MCSYFEGASGSGAGLFKYQRYILASKLIVKDTLLALEKLGIDVSRAWSEELYGPK